MKTSTKTGPAATASAPEMSPEFAAALETLQGAVRVDVQKDRAAHPSRHDKAFLAAMDKYAAASTALSRAPENTKGKKFRAAFAAVESAENALFAAADALVGLAPAAGPVEFNVDAFLMETLEEMDFDAVLMEHVTAAVNLDADKSATLAAEKAAPRAALLAHFHTSGDAVNATVRTFGAKAFLAGLKAAA
jgi:hypothetical protein